VRGSALALASARARAEDARAVRSPLRWIVVTIAFIAAGAFAVSVTAGQWWTIGEAQIGPFGTQACLGGECRARALTWAGGTPGWERAAVATGAAGLIAGLVLLVLAGACAAGRVPKIAAKSTLSAMLVAAVAGGLFIHGLPDLGETSIDRGLVLYVVGIALGLAAAVTVLRAPRPTS
jgi:hypothetical protein